MSFQIRAVLFEEAGWWVAQCLEYDIAIQARTQPALLSELERTLTGHLVVSAETGRKPFESLRSAPRRYWEMYERAEPVEADVPPLQQGDSEVSLPDIELRARAA
jgi:hypothetical protein